MQNVISLEIVNQLNIKKGMLLDAVLIIMGSIFVAVSSQLSFYLPFSPVPVTGQTFAVLLTGTILGSKRGGLSLAFYILQGALGLPVFAGGRSGIPVLIGPTFGYLVGFIFAGAVVGLLAEKGYDRRRISMAVSFLVGQVIIYVIGALWLASFVGIKNVLILGVAPFLVGDFLKMGMAIILLPSFWKLANKANQNELVGRLIHK